MRPSLKQIWKVPWMDECEEHTYHIQEPFVCPEWSVKPHAASPQNIFLDSLVWPPGGKQIKPTFLSIESRNIILRQKLAKTHKAQGI
jgi:hypothetical protein